MIRNRKIAKEGMELKQCPNCEKFNSFQGYTETRYEPHPNRKWGFYLLKTVLFLTLGIGILSTIVTLGIIYVYAFFFIYQFFRNASDIELHSEEQIKYLYDSLFSFSYGSFGLSLFVFVLFTYAVIDVIRNKGNSFAITIVNFFYQGIPTLLDVQTIREKEYARCLQCGVEVLESEIMDYYPFFYDEETHGSLKNLHPSILAFQNRKKIISTANELSANETFMAQLRPVNLDNLTYREMKERFDEIANEHLLHHYHDELLYESIWLSIYLENERTGSWGNPEAILAARNQFHFSQLVDKTIAL